MTSDVAVTAGVNDLTVILPDSGDVTIVSSVDGLTVASQTDLTIGDSGDEVVQAPADTEATITDPTDDTTVSPSVDDVAVTTDEGLVVTATSEGLPGTQGPPGAGVAPLQREANQALSGQRVVKALPDSKCDYADTGTAGDGDAVLGITQGAVSSGAQASIQQAGEMTEPSWTWAIGPIFAGANGVLTQSPPDDEWVKQVAVATAPTVIAIELLPTIVT